MEPREPFSILLIDWDEASSMQVKEQLARDPTSQPTRLDISKSGFDALGKLKRNRYHLILANHSLSHTDDIPRILSEIHQNKITTPFVLMVGPGEEAQARRFLKCGATDYLVRTGDELGKLSSRLWGIYRNFELTTPSEDFSDALQLENHKLMEVNEKFRGLSMRDELTGLYNHRYLQEKLVEEFTRAMRYRYSLSCLLIDLDHFRRVNEDLGFAVGDEILKEAAGILVESSRLSDLIARFGGEEFVILLPHIDYQGALELAERLRTLFAKHTFLADSHQIAMTVSIGVSSFPEDAVKHRSEILNLADQALFQAKAGGRNRAFLYRDLFPTIDELLPHLKISQEKIVEFQKRFSEIADRARRDYIESSKALIMALESKDQFTAGHSGRVGRLAMQIAETMGLPLNEAEIVSHAGLLHDIGKICISDEILLKPDRFTLAEYEAMKQHPYLGYRILKPIKFLQEEAVLVLHHHEWFNGQGYPCRLAANEIPLGARIVSVVDSYDTMQLAGRRYKKTISVEESVGELITCAGTQFDPEVVQAFIQVLLMRKELTQDTYDKERLQQVLEKK